MLTFTEKLAIIETFPQLQRKDVSLGRVNFHFEDSVYDKKIVVQHLHPNGNGFVFAGHLPLKDTDKDKKGLVNIRDYSEDDLRDLLNKSIAYLSEFQEELEVVSQYADLEGVWVGPNKQKLNLLQEDLLWNVYAGLNLEECFESPIEAKRYLMEEGFCRKKS